jgi:hypothetical protein
MKFICNVLVLVVVSYPLIFDQVKSHRESRVIKQRDYQPSLAEVYNSNEIYYI